MLYLEPLSERPGKWVARNGSGAPILLLENDPPVCRVRTCHESGLDRPGRLLAIFLGSDSFRAACRWVEEDVAADRPSRFPPARMEERSRSPITRRKIAGG